MDALETILGYINQKPINAGVKKFVILSFQKEMASGQMMDENAKETHLCVLIQNIAKYAEKYK